MAAKRKVAESFPQKVMYPKDLVYPSKGEEFQLEMIRCRQQQYQKVHVAVCQDDSIDMEMTVALDGNITLNVPVVGNKKDAEPLKKITADAADIDMELLKLCNEEDNFVTGKQPEKTGVQKNTLDSESENISYFDVSKENHAIQYAKPGFCFTPSANDESSLASWHGNSLMGTRLNFSEADSISVNCNSSFQRKPFKQISKGYQPYSYVAQESFSVLEEESLSVSNVGERNGLHRSAREGVKPQTVSQNMSLKMLPTCQELEEPDSATNMQSFVAFEDPSLSSVSLLDPHDPPTRSGSHKDSRSFPRVPLGCLVESKGKVLSEVKKKDPPFKSNKSVTVEKENDSIKQNNNLSTSCVNKKKVEVPSNPEGLPAAKEQEIGFTEYDIPSCSLYEPTSTPSGKRTASFNMSVELTAIHPDVVVPPNRAARMFVDKDLQDLNQLETIHEESRSNYTGSTSSSSSTTCKSTSRLSMLSGPTQPTEDEVLLEAEVMAKPGVIRAFTESTTSFMLQSIPVSRTVITKLSSSLRGKLDSDFRICIDDNNYAVEKIIVDGGFPMLYVAQSQTKRRKILKVDKSSCTWECAVMEELFRRLKANDLRSKVFSFLNIDALFLYTNASITVYDHHKFGRLSDLVRYMHSNKLMSHYELLMVYYTLELLDIVGTVHSCGIIHTDIKPDNLLIRDIRAFKSFSKARGHGLCLGSFSRSLDIQSFPRGCQFVGSNDSHSFRCPQMLNNDTPWTYQADLSCVANTTYVMMVDSDLKIALDKRSNLYKTSVPRRFDYMVWNKYFSSLLNWSPSDASEKPNMTELSSMIIEKTKCEQFQHSFSSLFLSYFSDSKW